jgi:uncharacterized protein YndB with AHSA1/START domain
MLDANARLESKLQVRRTFAAPAEKVFRAWTNREELERWMCRDVPTQRVRYLELDVRVGGGYVLEVADSASGDRYIGRGLFREITPQKKLVFTWSWTKKQADGSEIPVHPETQVTVEFLVHGSSTEVILTHEFFSTTGERNETETGWKGCLEALASVVERS